MSSASLPPASKEKPVSTKVAFGGGKNLKPKRQTWSDRASDRSKSPATKVTTKPAQRQEELALTQDEKDE